MLIAHRRLIIYTILECAAFVISFIVKSNDWGFALRLLSCVFAFISLATLTVNDDYYRAIYAGAKKRLGDTPFYYMDCFEEKDWHSMILLPSFMFGLGSGYLISPSLNFDTKHGVSDIICEVLGVVLFALVADGHLKINNSSLIKHEIDKVCREALKDKGERGK